MAGLSIAAKLSTGACWYGSPNDGRGITDIRNQANER